MKTLKTCLVHRSLPLPPLMNGSPPPPGNANTTFICFFHTPLLQNIFNTTFSIYPCEQVRLRIRNFFGFHRFSCKTAKHSHIGSYRVIKHKLHTVLVYHNWNVFSQVYNIKLLSSYWPIIYAYFVLALRPKMALKKLLQGFLCFQVYVPGLLGISIHGNEDSMYNWK